MATWVRSWKNIDMFMVLTVLIQHVSCDDTSTFVTTSRSSSETATMIALAETPFTSIPSSTTEGPLQRHLALIIGVPTGIGLSVVGLLVCVTWLACSSYCEYRKSLPQQGNTGVGTRSTNVQVNANSYTKSASVPMKPVSTSAGESQAFQPEPDPDLEELDAEPDQDSSLEQDHRIQNTIHQ